jgi:hypothetical protein
MNERELAQRLLDAHTALRAAEDTEPQLPDDADGSHPDAPAWLKWHTEVKHPAYEAWRLAVSDFNIGLGGSSTHPMVYLPRVHKALGLPALCEYKIAHTVRRVLATTEIVTRGAPVPACGDCRAVFDHPGGTV